jgi:hypothetical protein
MARAYTGPILTAWGDETNPQFSQKDNPFPTEAMPSNASWVWQTTMVVKDTPSLILPANSQRRNAIIQIADAKSLWFSFDGRESVTPDINFYEVAGKKTLNLLKEFGVVTTLAIYATLADEETDITVHVLEFI